MSNEIINNFNQHINLTLSRLEGKPSARNKRMVKADLKDYLKTTSVALQKHYASHAPDANEINDLKELKNRLIQIDKKLHISEAKSLAKKIEKIVLHGPGKMTFLQKTDTLNDRIQLSLAKFAHSFMAAIQKKTIGEVFAVWMKKVRYKQNVKSLPRLEKTLNRLEKQLKLHPKNKKIEARIEKTTKNIESKQKYIKEFETNRAKADETRALFSAVGGKRLALETKDGETIDATLLKAEDFYQRFRSSGAQMGHIHIHKNDAIVSTLSGFVFEDAEAANELLEQLEQLNLFKKDGEKGSGWAKLELDHKIYILPDYQVDELMGQRIEGEYPLERRENRQITTEIAPFPPFDSSKSGTLILGTGAASQYEMHKREAISLLMQGMNVMLFNYKGLGESTGKPSATGAYEDIEAVYQYLHQVERIPDKKIVAKGLCLSGGVVAELASRHPHINVILDQTYADIREIGLNVVLKGLRTSLSIQPEKESKAKECIVKLLTPLLRGVVNMTMPPLSVSKHIQKIKGKILVLRALDDKYIPKWMTDKIVQKYAKKASFGQMYQQMKIESIPGQHATLWLDANEGTVAVGRRHMFSFLNSAGVFNAPFDQGTILEHLETKYAGYLLDVFQNFDKAPKNLPDIEQNLRLQRVETVVELPALASEVDTSKMKSALEDLEGLKEKLGGAPNLDTLKPGKKKKNQKFFGFPIESARLWFSKAIRLKWFPKPLWLALAKKVGVGKEPVTKFEFAHTQIKGITALKENSEEIKRRILKNDKPLLYFQQVSGLSYHPTQNSPQATIKAVDDLIALFEMHYEQAKKTGTLEEFFSKFFDRDRVCFEDVTKGAYEYVLKHPIAGEIEIPLDYDSNTSVQEILLKELDNYKQDLIKKGANIDTLLISLDDFKKYLLEKRNVYEINGDLDGVVGPITEEILQPQLEKIRDQLLLLE